MSFPGPRTFNPLGSALAFTRDPLGFLFDNARRYGGLYRARFFHSLVYFVHRPDITQTLCVHHAKALTKDRHLAALFGQGVLSSDGPTWYNERKHAQPYFGREALERYVPIIARVVTRRVSRWTHGPVDVYSEMAKLSVESVYRTLFSDTAFDVDGLNDAMQTASASYLEAQGVSLAPLFGMKSKAAKCFEDAMRRFDAYADEIIARHWDAAPETYLGLLIERLKSGALERSLLRDQIKTFMLAGQETTALASTFTLHLLAHHPDAQHRAREEASASAWPPASVDDALAFPYIRAVLKESMRLYPPVWTLPRTVVARCPVGTATARAGSYVNMLQISGHRDPGVYERPDAFDPDRWTESFERTLPQGAFFPFGLGPRRCIGERYAWIELPMIIGETVRRFHVTSNQASTVPLTLQLTLRPEQPVVIRVEPVALRLVHTA